MLRVSILGLVPAAAFAFSLCACGDSSHVPSHAMEQSAAQAAAPGRASSPAGATALDAVSPFQRRRIVEALGEVAFGANLQVAFDAAAAAAKPHYAVTHQARQELVEGIAAQVARGTIDRAALQPKIDALNKCIEDEDSANRAAISSVSGKFTSTQVNAFHTALAQRFPTRRGAESVRRGWSRALGLSNDQRARLGAEMVPSRSTSVSEERLAQNGGRRLLRIISFLETAVPTLTPQQRAIASHTLRANLETTLRAATQSTQL